MKQSTVFLMFALTVGLMAQAVFAKPALRIEKVSVSPKTIDISKGEKAVISLETSEAAFLTFTLKDENNNPILQKHTGLEPAGNHTFEWDGKDETNKFVTTDAVIYTVDARTEDGRYARFDPSAETGGQDLADFHLAIDRKTGRIAYVLPRAGRARLRMGLAGNLLLRTLFDWQAQEAGRHEIAWDGLDESGEIKMLDHPDLNLNLNAFSLPDNTIIVSGHSVVYQAPDSAYQPAGAGKHFHYPHPRIECHEPRFDVMIPESALQVVTNPKKGEWPPTAPRNDIVVSQSKIPVRVTIDPLDAPDLIRKRFEVMFYLDTQFLYEEEQALTPNTFMVDLSNVQPGIHFLTVNVMSYNDHVGVRTIKLEVTA